MGDSLRLIIFESSIGWIGICHDALKIVSVKIAYLDSLSLCKAFHQWEVGPSQPNAREKKMITLFGKYLAGKPVDFGVVEIATDALTDFQRSVVHHCRAIPFGTTVSYGELAAMAGRPKAARAVGTVMRNNAFPIIVPCHRVVAANGLGGFSSPQGCKTKLQLHAVESMQKFD